MAGFQPGDRVHIATLGTGVVRDVRNGGRYVVELKGRTFVVAAAQMETAPDDRQRKPASGGLVPPEAARPLVATLDLHGKTAMEAVESLDTFLNEALLTGLSEVRVIHGRSGGTLKAAVHARLAMLPPVRGFRLDPRNPGVTIVAL
jgi:DNA mismatch repair protein MutS2